VATLAPNTNLIKTHIHTTLYTVSQKTIHLTFDHNLSKYIPILKILSPTGSQGSCVTITSSSTSP